jgi:biopolymer transport protein ExbD
MNAQRPRLGAAAARAIRCEIQVTPLADVCLTLLIIFMVVTPLMDRDVLLPRTDRPDKLDGRPITITLFFTAPVRVRPGDDGARLSLDEFCRWTATLDGAEGNRTFLVRADSRLGFAPVRETLSCLGSAGHRAVAIAAERKPRSGGL